MERFFSKEKVMKQYHRELRKLNKSQCEANIAQKDALLALRNEVGASQLALKERVKEVRDIEYLFLFIALERRNLPFLLQFQTHSSSQTSKHLIPTESILFQVLLFSPLLVLNLLFHLLVLFPLRILY